jgi:hypothetical protein
MSEKDKLIGDMQSLCAQISHVASRIRSSEELVQDASAMLNLTVAINDAQNACIDCSRALSVAHDSWLARNRPDLKKASATDWIEAERRVKEYEAANADASDLPQVLNDIDRTP